MQSVPRLMPNQAVIVGVGTIALPAEWQAADPRTIAELGISKVVTITSTYDHRVIQGAQSGEFLAAIQAATDRIEPEDLAERLRQSDPALHLVDIRSPEEYAHFHIRGAVNVPAAHLAAHLESRFIRLSSWQVKHEDSAIWAVLAPNGAALAASLVQHDATGNRRIERGKATGHRDCHQMVATLGDKTA